MVGKMVWRAALFGAVSALLGAASALMLPWSSVSWASGVTGCCPVMGKEELCALIIEGQVGVGANPKFNWVCGDPKKRVFWSPAKGVFN